MIKDTVFMYQTIIYFHITAEGKKRRIGSILFKVRKRMWRKCNERKLLIGKFRQLPTDIFCFTIYFPIIHNILFSIMDWLWAYGIIIKTIFKFLCSCSFLRQTVIWWLELFDELIIIGKTFISWECATVQCAVCTMHSKKN